MTVKVHFILNGETNWRTVTDIECEAKDREQLEGLIADLNKAGYDVRQVELAD
jgi:hypothetical protein